MRVNIISPATEDDEGGRLVGWFDPDRAERFDQARTWDGNNRVGVITRSDFVDEYLYRTAAGRWVLNHDAHRCNNGPNTYRYLTEEEAQDWLIRSEVNDEAVTRFFGELPDEPPAPGRPEIGPAFSVRFPADLLARVDAAAAEAGITRAAWLREAAEVELDLAAARP